MTTFIIIIWLLCAIPAAVIAHSKNLNVVAWCRGIASGNQTVPATLGGVMGRYGLALRVWMKRGALLRLTLVSL